MKKIVSAVALAAVAAGLATAELNSSLNVRMGGSVFTKKMADAGDTTNVLDLGSSDFGCDGLSFKASNDYAGVTLNWGASLQDKQKGGNQATTFWTNNGKGIELSAWLKPADFLKFQIGAHKDGIWTAEQCKKDTDDTSWSGAGKYAFLYKPGVQSKNNSTGYFLDAMTDVLNGGQAYLYADFSLMEGALSIRPTFVSTGVDFLQKKDKESDEAVMKTAPGAVVTFKNDAIKLNVDFQMPTNKDIAAGVYVSPLGLLDNALQLMVGGTFSTNTSSATDNLGYTGVARDTTFFAVDLRVRYVAGDFHIANAFNFTGASEDDVVVQGSGSAKTGDMHIWDAIFLTYKLNDNWTVTGDVQIDVITGSGADDDAYLDLYVTPGVMYTCGKGATITAGLHFDVADLSDNTAKTTTISVPFVFRVKM
mgnify:CR=1 FL=1